MHNKEVNEDNNQLQNSTKTIHEETFQSDSVFNKHPQGEDVFSGLTHYVALEDQPW
jgi:hypothetical protein